MRPMKAEGLYFHRQYEKPEGAVFVTVRRRKVLFWDRPMQEPSRGLAASLEERVKAISIMGTDYCNHVRYHGIILKY